MTEPIAVSAGATVRGDLTVPADAMGTVVLAHDSGVCRHSPRSEAVARTLQDDRMATFVVDLLDPREEGRAEVRFDIGELTARLSRVLDTVTARDDLRRLPLALFGAGTAAAAALAVAAARPRQVTAVVSRDGRPDLAAEDLDHVSTPALFLVGERDEETLRKNQWAGARLRGCHELRIVPGTTHVFDETGALEGAAVLTSSWLRGHLPVRQREVGEVTA
ncbi:alpha/beta hydrolase [Qaidamihabitans albus]|uniref:alpha/beta hydrolase n=1 Tax=Qaidamihabitans albus TaxID=2795733 RepID=UPI0018F2530E|nr:alpha/beta hydrolase [Qaidamihabitans albus]